MIDAEADRTPTGFVVGLAFVLVGTALNAANVGGWLGLASVLFGAALVVEGLLRGV